ncbi:MAG: ribonuclease J [Bacilli bacterium]|nr:ribonuclease J [Bacilli bacterium]
MANIKIMSLGGLGENGKNLTVVEVDKKIFILDAGMRYPDIDMYGVDQVIPNIDYLIKNKNNIQGIFISHGHDENVGAVPYLLKHLQTKVYASHFTISIIEAMLIEDHMKIKNYKLYRVNANRVMKFGDVEVSFFHTSHSLPESLGFAINTKDGSIVYCTDFNFCTTSGEKYQTTFDKITDLGKKKVLALLSESVNAGMTGRITNDTLLEHHYKSILLKNKKRIFVTCYVSDLIRIQKIIDLSIADNRKVCVLSKKTERIFTVAISSKYLNIPEEYLLNVSDYSKEELEKLENVVIIIAGTRNEPYHIMSKIVLDEEFNIKFNNQDKLVVMCPPAPGIEKLASDTINILSEYDIDYEIFDRNILRSQHASPEDLKLLYSMLKPQYIIPVKGEYRQMYDQFLVAKSLGYTKDNVILMDNGEVLLINDGKVLEEREEIACGDIFIDGSSIGVVDSDVIAERSILAEEGAIFVYCVIDLRLRQIHGDITVKTRGFTHSFTTEELTNVISGLTEKIINNSLKKKTWSKEDVEACVSEETRKLITRFTRHRPVVVPVFLEI